LEADIAEKILTDDLNSLLTVFILMGLIPVKVNLSCVNKYLPKPRLLNNYPAAHLTNFTIAEDTIVITAGVTKNFTHIPAAEPKAIYALVKKKGVEKK
jgi:hypothetical protein